MSSAAAAVSGSSQHAHAQPHLAPQPMLNFHQEDGEDGEDDDDDDGTSKKPADKKSGRRKIKIEFINDKSRRHITFSKRKAGIMKKAYELSTLTGTQVLLLVVSETGLVYTFTTAKLQPLVTQPEGKNLIQACLNAPAGQIPTGAPIGQAGNSVHQANLHAHPHPHQQPPPSHPPQQAAQVPGPTGQPPHPASGVAQGIPPPNAMPPPSRNMPGGLSIGDKRGGMGDEDDMEDDEDDDENGGNSASDDPISPLVNRGVGPPMMPGHPGHQMQPGGGQRSPPLGMHGMQQQQQRGGPAQGRGGAAAAAASHAARGAHHGVHPYAGGGATTRDGHRRRTSSSTNPAQGGGGGGKITSPRMGMQRQQSGMSDGSGMDNQSPTMGHYPGHDQGGPPPGMYGYPQQQAPGQQGYPGQQPQGWGQPGMHPAHRR